MMGSTQHSRDYSPTPISRIENAGQQLDRYPSPTMEHNDSERASFLQGMDHEYIGPASNPKDDDHLIPRSYNVFTITVVSCALILVLDIAGSVPMAPHMVIYENIVCRNHYAAWQDDARLGNCKIEAVQSELARINGWQHAFGTIPGLLLSIPYGALANRIGREKVLLLGLVGCVLSDSWSAIVCSMPQYLPLQAVWLSGLFQMIGGGGGTVVALCYTMIGDACLPAQRTTAFSQLHAAFLLSELISIPLGSAFITINPWIPVLGALALLMVATLFMFLFMLNTTSFRLENQSAKNETPSALPHPKTSGKVLGALSHHIANLVVASSWITKEISLMLLALFVYQLGRQFSSVLLQYASVKFNWQYAQASYLIALRAGMNFLVLIVLIPWLTRFFLKQKGLGQTTADKYITVVSGLCLTVGSVLIFLSSTTFFIILGQSFIGLGFAFAVTARSFLTAMVGSRHLSLLYTTMTTVTYGGVMVGGPLLASAFQWGLQLSGFWLGMPFLVTAILFAIATLIVCTIRAET